MNFQTAYNWLVHQWQRVSAFTRSPIMWAEYRFQAQTTTQNNFLVRISFLVAVCLQIISGIVYLLGFMTPTLATWLNYSAYQLNVFLTNALFVSIGALGIVTMIIHYQPVSRSALSTASSFVREKSGNNWDMLLLTGIDARALVLGKWWASVEHAMRKHWRGVALRAVFLLWLVLVIDRIGIHVEVYPRWHNVMLALLLLLGGWMLLIAQTSASGLFGSALGGQHFGRARLAGQCSQGCIVLPLRIALGVALLIGAFIYIDPTLFSSPTLTPQQEHLMILLFIMFPYDIGSLLVLCLVTPSTYHQNHTGLFLLGAVAVFGLEILYIWLGLRAAQFVAVKQRVVPPGQP